MGRPVSPLAILGMLASLAGPAHAQARVSFSVSVFDPGTGRPMPQVQVRNLIRDSRFREALQNSLPLRLHYQVEIWRVRPDWFDDLERSFEWDFVIEYEPLVDQYTTTRIFRGSVRDLQRFPTLRELELAVELPQRVSIRPAGTGEYYFIASLQIRTLTDQEMEELERFLRGEPAPEDEPDNRGNPLGRVARRWLLRFGGLPTENKEAKSERFRVGG